MTAPQPLDELGATTRLRFFLCTRDGSWEVEIPSDRAGDDAPALLANPPGDTTNADCALVVIERFRRGEAYPYEFSTQLRALRGDGSARASIAFDQKPRTVQTR